MGEKGEDFCNILHIIYNESINAIQKNDLHRYLKIVYFDKKYKNKLFDFFKTLSFVRTQNMYNFDKSKGLYILTGA